MDPKDVQANMFTVSAPTDMGGLRVCKYIPVAPLGLTGHVVSQELMDDS